MSHAWWHRKRKRRPEQEPEPERPDTEMRQKLRQRSAEEGAWQDADANGISRSASADFEVDPDAPAGTILAVPQCFYTNAFGPCAPSHVDNGKVKHSEPCLAQACSPGNVQRRITPGCLHHTHLDVLSPSNPFSALLCPAKAVTLQMNHVDAAWLIDFPACSAGEERGRGAGGGGAAVAAAVLGDGHHPGLPGALPALPQPQPRLHCARAGVSAHPVSWGRGPLGLAAYSEFDHLSH